MSAKPSYFQIGLFVVIATAILVAGLIAFGAGQMFRPRIYFETYVDGTVQGIEVGSAVKFRGVPIGRVSQISFTFNEYGAPSKVDRYNYVVIVMEVDTPMFPGMFSENLTSVIQKNVEQGMRARIEPLGITGMNYIEINYVKDPAQFPPLEVDWKPHYYYIPSAPGQLTNILDSVNSMMTDLKNLNLGALQGGLVKLLDNLNTAITGADLKKVSDDLQVLIKDLNQAIVAANIGPLSDEARQLMSGLMQTNNDLHKILKNLEPSTRLNAAEIKAIIRNLENTSSNLEQFSAEVKRRPSLLLWGTPKTPTPTPTPRPKRNR